MLSQLRFLCVMFFLFAASSIAFSQNNPYVLNGSATQNNCHCYTLTQDLEFETGSIWNKNKIDLSKPFDYFFNVNLGCKDIDGADGIVFVLQPVSTSLGNVGAGIGFEGIRPSIGVTIDTYQNPEQNDPPYDHITIQANGDTYHNSANNLAGPVTALANSDNIEDCNFHVLRINWQPSKNLLEVSMDGVLRLSLTKDIISTIFNNDPLVYWGFTSSTGGLSNVQQICTSLNASFYLAPHTTTCTGAPLTFLDSSISSVSITKWFWNFDDGTTSAEKNPPKHIYQKPGIYNIKLNVEGNDGCISDTFYKQITIGTYPVADFTIQDLPVCTNRSAVFKDAATVQVGTINKWFWDFGNNVISNEQNPPPQSYTIGAYSARLFVETTEGCASDTIEKKLHVAESPGIDLSTSVSQACKNDLIAFNAKNYSNTIDIKRWYLDFGDKSFSADPSANHVYTNAGNYVAKIVAQADNNCITDTVSKTITIYATNANAGKDTTVLMDYPYQLQASGGDNYRWSPSTGLNNPFIANPIATISNNQTYILTTTTTLGCATSDTLNLKVVKGPEIYAPSAFTPNGDGLNDRFKIIPVGIIQINAFVIYNRLGQKMYSSVNAREGWDGTLKGMPQRAGTYVWMASGKAIDGKTISVKNTIVLIR